MRGQLNLKNKHIRGFTLVELVISMALVGVGGLIIGEIMIQSTKENRRFASSMTDSIAMIGFKKTAIDITSSMGASLDFLHLPVKLSCDSQRSPCVRKFNPTSLKFDGTSTGITTVASNCPASSSATLTAASTGVIDFFQDQSLKSDGSSCGLVISIPSENAGSTGGAWDKLYAIKNPGLYTTPLTSAEEYVTWPVVYNSSFESSGYITQSNISDFFSYFAYSKDNQIFALDPSSATNNTAAITGAAGRALFMPNPALSSTSATATTQIAKYNRQLFVYTTAEDNSKHVILETSSGTTADADHCAAAGNCTAAFTSYAPSVTGSYTTYGNNLTTGLVSLLLKPVNGTNIARFIPKVASTLYAQPRLFTNSTGSAPTTGAGGPPSALDNQFYFPSCYPSVFERNGDTTTSTDVSSSLYSQSSTSVSTDGTCTATTPDLVQKFAFASNNLSTLSWIAAPITFSRIYLKKKTKCLDRPTQTPGTDCYQVIKEDYNGTSTIGTQNVIFDEIYNSGFLLVTRKVGGSEISFRIYNQPYTGIITN